MSSTMTSGPLAIATSAIRSGSGRRWRRWRRKARRRARRKGPRPLRRRPPDDGSAKGVGEESGGLHLGPPRLTSRDRLVVLGLVGLLAILSIAISGPAVSPGAVGPSVQSGPDAASGSPAPLVYREGIVGRPESINPLTARTQPDRDIVALVFSGLVRPGPGGVLRPDLAASWT